MNRFPQTARRPAVRTRPVLGAATSLSLGLAVVLGAPVGSAFAAQPVPRNLGAGLEQLVARDLAARGGAVTEAAAPTASLDSSDRAIYDAEGRVLVNILLNASGASDRKVARKAVTKALNTASTNVGISTGTVIIAQDMTYKGGIIEAFVPVSEVAALARSPGVSAVHLCLRPFTNVGATTSQGVVQHRVDQFTNQAVSPVTGITGAGITVGVMSDSFDTSTTDATGGPTATRAAGDVLTGDLPGPGNPNNATPVNVLAELPAGTPTNTNIDEGRAMCQIIHDMAPKANLAYATAFLGEVSFANNIRLLARPVAQGGGGCQVIVDDIINFAEGMFEDTIVARAADEVSRQGVSYFSSAGNRPATQGYFSDVRIVPSGTGLTAAAGNTSLANTNINLAGVPARLYAGGFHNFNPTAGQLDVAQAVAIGTSATFSFQWEDPYDVTPVTVGAPFASGSGSVAVDPTDLNGTTAFDFTFNGTTSQRVRIRVANAADTFDAVVTLIAPSGNVVTVQDTGNGETILLFLPETGTYTVRVEGFDATPAAPGGESTGSFDYSVSNVSGQPLISTDFNLLFFRTDTGAFIGGTGEDNLSTNRPIETPRITNAAAGSLGSVQIVVGRSNTPPAGTPQATKLRYVTFTSGQPQEYFSYQTPVTFGHNSAAGAIGVAAYPFFPPFVPEGFTSPGIAFISFDQNNNRLATPEIRLKPDLAAMDGANTTFFPGFAGGDATQDTDAFPNFFGTSAAAPHAAAIAALVLEAKGGPGSVTPAQMRTILQRSAFPHDLDPYSSRAVVRAGNARLTLVAEADGSSTQSTISPNVFSLNYVGGGSLTQFVLNPQATDATAGNPTEPVSTTVNFTSRPGIIFDNRAPTTGFPFTVGSVRGTTVGSISGVLSNQAPAPAVADSQFYTLTVNVTGGLPPGGGFTFGIDRDEADAFGPNASVGGNSADLLGAGVLIPQGTLAPGGLTVSATANGTTGTGVFVNRIGAGFSALDGFGFINAQSAINQPLP